MSGERGNAGGGRSGPYREGGLCGCGGEAGVRARAADGRLPVVSGGFLNRLWLRVFRLVVADRFCEPFGSRP